MLLNPTTLTVQTYLPNVVKADFTDYVLGKTRLFLSY